MFPVTSGSSFKNICHLRDVFAAEGVPAIVWQWPSFQWHRIPAVCLWIWLCAHYVITSFSSIQWIHGEKCQECLQENWWFPQCFGTCITSTLDTPITSDLPSPAEILHGHLAQGSIPGRHSKPINIQQIQQKLIQIQDKQKEHFDKAHRSKDLCVLKIQEQVKFLPNEQETAPLKW